MTSRRNKVAGDRFPSRLGLVCRRRRASGLKASQICRSGEDSYSGRGRRSGDDGRLLELLAPNPFSVAAWGASTSSWSWWDLYRSGCAVVLDSGARCSGLTAVVRRWIWRRRRLCQVRSMIQVSSLFGGRFMWLQKSDGVSLAGWEMLCLLLLRRQRRRNGALDVDVVVLRVGVVFVVFVSECALACVCWACIPLCVVRCMLS